MNSIALTVFVILLHVAAVVAGIYLTNLTGTGEAYYGGPTGPLPGAASGYHAITEFLSPGGTAVDSPGERGGFGFLGWIFTSALCVLVDLTKMLLSVTTFNYAAVQIIPSAGFGLWVKVLIHAASAVLSAVQIARLVAFGMASGALSNPYLLGALGFISVAGILATLSNAGGILTC